MSTHVLDDQTPSRVKRPKGRPSFLVNPIRACIYGSQADMDLLRELGGSAWIRAQLHKERDQREQARQMERAASLSGHPK